MKKYHTVIPASYVIYKPEGKILLGLRYNTGYDDGRYSLPAGHLEPLEGPLAAARREFKEETGIELAEEDLRLVHIAYRRLKGQSDRVDFYYICDNQRGNPQLMEPDKCAHWLFFDLNQLPSSLNQSVAATLQAIGRGLYSQEIDF